MDIDVAAVIQLRRIILTGGIVPRYQHEEYRLLIGALFGLLDGHIESCHEDIDYWWERLEATNNG